jgi:hypothetical protein
MIEDVLGLVLLLFFDYDIQKAILKNESVPLMTPTGITPKLVKAALE